MPAPYPGHTHGLPTDPDGDGFSEDVNGNGRMDFDDVVVFYRNIEWVRNYSPVGAGPYDFNGNGRIDLNDVVLLFKEVIHG
ncbi:MAG: dockerin type I domain-containing protein [Methanoregulaceae archaeon]|jgi:PKD repeat protein